MMNLWLWLIKSILDVGDRFGQEFLFDGPVPGVTPLFINLPYGGHKLQSMDGYRPAGSERLPVLIYIHGGGWVSGDKGTYSHLCKEIAAQGFVVFNVNYRLAPAFRFPTPIQDAARAIRQVQSMAEAYGGDPNRIFLAGESAGAYLALWYATALHSPTHQLAIPVRDMIPVEALKGLALFFGLFDLEGERSWLARPFIRGFLGEERDGLAARARAASPIHALCADLAPVLVICGERDVIYHQSTTLVRALDGCGARYQTLLFPAKEFPNAGHAFSKWSRRKCTRMALEEVVRFMREKGGE